MKSMKALSMNKMLGGFKRKTTPGVEASDIPDLAEGSSPDAIASHSVRQFCENGGPNAQGDEVLFLPPIVESAESSPAAAAECARLIRKYLNRDYASKPSCQYNAIMLMRILTDNPGPSFTRNFDKKFVDAAKELLRSGRDPSVRQLLMETLDTFEYSKMDDQNLAPLIEMWKKEKDRAYRSYGNRMPNGPNGPPPPMQNAPPFDPGSGGHQQNYFARNHSNKKLPNPVELESRLEEAKTSAKLLAQVVTNTPATEVLGNELIKEFADRCQSASRSIQAYMTAEEPAPDNDTMESLIDTNEQLQSALMQHQRAVLGARKQLGIGERSENTTPVPDSASTDTNGFSRPADWPASTNDPMAAPGGLRPPPLPSRAAKNGKGKEAEVYQPAAGSGSGKNLPDEPAEDPFRDPQQPGTGSSSRAGSSLAVDRAEPPPPQLPRLGAEPFHPGFNPTPSYLGRQESALGKTAMHGAASGGGGSSTPPGAGSGSGSAVGSAGGSGLGPAAAGTAVGEQDNESDIYDSTPNRKDHMYRY